MSIFAELTEVKDTIDIVIDELQAIKDAIAGLYGHQAPVVVTLMHLCGDLSGARESLHAISGKQVNQAYLDQEQASRNMIGGILNGISLGRKVTSKC